MRSSFDRRVLPEPLLELIRACQRRAPCHLGGGAALSGAYLAHRLSRDVDLFCHRLEDVRTLVRELGAIAHESGLELAPVRDGGGFVRVAVRDAELDLVHDAVPDLASPPPPVEGIVVESLDDLRANKLTCILSRSEPRDLVDLLFLDRAGFPPERDLPLALRKGGGIDPAILAWLLGQFPVKPLPLMLAPLTEEDLLAFRNDLRERLRRAALPPEAGGNAP
ncbi:MAG TPA: nucleotidyl transferase AbiEii/AbiGii toxin family protein [Planctomycetota bacterium]|nr:nucleotidyl transferase AbiEii/AbiGii toxin family protein [Planctomycetota bacterium]